MQDFKNKLYNYETPPPEGIWDQIIEELNKEKVIKIYNRRRPRYLFYGITAAASVIIIFFGSIFFKKDAPTPEKDLAANHAKSGNASQEKIKDSMILNQEILKSIINSPEEKKEIVSNPSVVSKKYLTVAGPEGHPVKISPKVATLIISADNEYPPKPVWSRKIDKWQKIMLSNTISPTSADLADMLQLAATSDNIE